jgi:deferrochelatase/peroxidase EfeB
MISITERKPGLLRAFTQRVVFWVIGGVAGKLYAPGFLGTIGSIHFARWVTVPKSRNLVFLSNYGGSWESYLEDFVTRAHAGLTGVWSNTIGFPRTKNLIQQGATDSENFKRFARRSMQPTLFWYSAYPQLTTAAIRTNAQIRRGLSGAMTEDEASVWLSLFGSAVRPPSKLVSSEIQSLLLGGLGFLPFGTCLLIGSLPDDRARAVEWLKALQPLIAYNDGRRLDRDAVVTLALGPMGLKRLGLPDSALRSFPYAFTTGMTGGGRDRILGDDVATFLWGAQPVDAALLIYGLRQSAVRKLSRDIEAICARTGATLVRRIPLKKVSKDKREPFGFTDGISQPVIRGTYKGMRNADPIHLVEPGEFILGYPDNRGFIPPGPTLPAIEDPTNLLPLVARRSDFDQNVVESQRDVGFNGSFLVIRELEQDVEAFWTYCKAEAQGLRSSGRLPPPYVLDEFFVAAKLVGRWPDGSSLARHPYVPKSAVPLTHPTTRPTSLPETAVATPVEKPPSARPPAPGDNDFLFGAEDPEALRCPFGAHIRRTNPRDSLSPGSAEEIDISNRHRIMRVGRLYAHGRRERPGLLFMCLNGDLERQFEFIQQTWVRNPAFHGLTCETDPLLGDGSGINCSYTIPSRHGPVRLSAMSRFVTTRGGGYFFLPGKRLVDFLADRK